MSAKFWADRSVLITGHTGFKGSWLALWLSELGAKVTGLALEPPSTPNLFEVARVAQLVTSIRGDVRDDNALRNAYRDARAEIVFHMAAQSLVREGYREPAATFATNVLGTVNCLEAARHAGTVRAVVIVTSDKCYRSRPSPNGHREDDELGGTEPYGASKACAEIVTEAYRSSFFSTQEHRALIASVRAGNVIGGGDWARDRLVPDAVRAFTSARPLELRHPSATRPWQHVLDPLNGYLAVGEKLLKGDTSAARAWNFGPEAKDVMPVRWVAEQLASRWGSNAKWRAQQRDHELYEAETLLLDSTLARKQLEWRPKLALPTALDWVVEWYRTHYEGGDCRSAAISQLRKFMSLVAD